MPDRIHDYPGPPRVCHEGHVYYNEPVTRERYDIPDLKAQAATRADIDEPLDVVISGGPMGGCSRL